MPKLAKPLELHELQQYSAHADKLAEFLDGMGLLNESSVIALGEHVAFIGDCAEISFVWWPATGRLEILRGWVGRVGRFDARNPREVADLIGKAWQ